MFKKKQAPQPERRRQISGAPQQPSAVFSYHAARSMRPDVARDARAAGLHHALVLVRESWHGSLAARMRAVGAPPLLTESWLPSVDACALQLTLDAVPPGTEGLPAVNWIVGRVRDTLPGAVLPLGAIMGCPLRWSAGSAWAALSHHQGRDGHRWKSVAPR